MQFQELRSGFLSAMKPLEVTATEFDFAESIDSAIMFFAVNMPAESVPELIRVYNTDPQPVEDRQATLPSGFMKVESVQLAKLRDVNDNPIYIPATIVNQRVFMNSVQYSDEPMISLFNGLINYNPTLAAAVTGRPGSINMVYRALPTMYRRPKRDYGVGIKIAVLDQVDGVAHSFTTETEADTWEGLGLDTKSLIGGTLVMQAGPNVYIMAIDYAWDDDGGVFSGLHVSESQGFASLPDGEVYDAYVVEKPDYILSGNNMYSRDTVSPDLNQSFHHAILDYAIARFLFTRKPEVAGQFMQNVYQTLNAYGINMKIEFGGEEV